MKFEDGVGPFRHPYANCIINIPINELMQVGLPYYLLFAYRLNFEFHKEEEKILGDSIVVESINRINFWDLLYSVYGIECYFEDRNDDKEFFIAKMGSLLKKISVPCLIDCYYDPSTEYAGVYRKVHEGHGRIVTKMDSEYVYYYATDFSDSPECFKISLDEFYLACERILYFKYPALIKSKKERHEVLKKILWDWFVEKDYQKMLDDISIFSEAVRSKPSLREETENQFPRNKIPSSHLFHALVSVSRSRGATIAFLNGYIDEFGYKAYRIPLQYLERSLELWNLVRTLLVKYGMAPKQSLQESMADYLLEISHAEQKAVEGIQKAICDEMNISI